MTDEERRHLLEVIRAVQLQSDAIEHLLADISAIESYLRTLPHFDQVLYDELRRAHTARFRAVGDLSAQVKAHVDRILRDAAGRAGTESEEQ